VVNPKYDVLAHSLMTSIQNILLKKLFPQVACIISQLHMHTALQQQLNILPNIANENLGRRENVHKHFVVTVKCMLWKCHREPHIEDRDP